MKPTVRFNTPYAEDGDDDSGVQRQDIPRHADGLEYEESYEERSIKNHAYNSRETYAEKYDIERSRNVDNAHHNRRSQRYDQRLQTNNGQVKNIGAKRDPQNTHNGRDPYRGQYNPYHFRRMSRQDSIDDTDLYEYSVENLDWDNDLVSDTHKERLEWQNMLAAVLKGEIIKSEKRRLERGKQREQVANMNQIWLGLRSMTRGHSVADERALIEEQRQQVDGVLQEVINFMLKPDDVPAIDQVAELLQRVDKCESLYPSRKIMMESKPLYKSSELEFTLDTLNSWLTVTRSLQTQLKILQNWTGSETLEIARPNDAPPDAENPSFIERILKENGLKRTFEKRTLSTLNSLLGKAKRVMIDNADAFAKMKLPPYINELQKLLNFPTKLMEECMKLLLEYANRLSSPTIVMVQQTMDDFRIALELACQIKHQYLELMTPAPGWEIPPCIDENYNKVLLDSLKFYFKLLQWKLKNGIKTVTVKEAEMLDNEWHFLNRICRRIEGGESTVAVQFCMLNNKLLQSIISSLESQLKLPESFDNADKAKWYNKCLENIRLRTRKLLRFTRYLIEQLENASEYYIEDERYPAFIEALRQSNHVLIASENTESSEYTIVATPSLAEQPERIMQMLGSIFTQPEKLVNHDRQNVHDRGNAFNDENEPDEYEYVLVLSPPMAFEWTGQFIQTSLGNLDFPDFKKYRTRLVADGAAGRLQSCKKKFSGCVDGLDMKCILETRANVFTVNRELTKVKRTVFKFVNILIDSVGSIRKSIEGVQDQDLIENCFGFATEVGLKSLRYMHRDQVRADLNEKLTKLAIEWVSFICDDCIPTDRKTYRWAVMALEFAMTTNRGNNILGLSEEEFEKLKEKVSLCMRLLVQHVDIGGAKSSREAQERELVEAAGALANSKKKNILGTSCNKATDSLTLRQEMMNALRELEAKRLQSQIENRLIGKVLDDNQPEYRPLVFLASSSSNISLRWQQGKFLGAGTFGSVYMAVNLDSGELMAVKEIRFPDPSSLTTLYKSVKEEMSVMEKLNHPNIVSYYGIEVHRDKVYIFMEYCQGGSLSSLLEHGRIENETVIQCYTYQMLKGISYLHDSDVIHRDVKPDNILLDHAGVIKFVDFGAAKILAKNQKTMGRTTVGVRTGANSLTGTPMYMAPEIITGGEKGRKGSMDIWSLGCCVLEMATGRRPWHNLDNDWAVMYHVVTGHPPLPDPSQLSEQGMDFLKQCFIQSAVARPTAKELLQHPWIREFSDVYEPINETNSYNTSSTEGLMVRTIESSNGSMYLVQDAALSETSMISVESEAGLGNVHNGGNEANLNVASEIAVEEIRKVDETTSKPVNGISGDVISFN